MDRAGKLEAKHRSCVVVDDVRWSVWVWVQMRKGGPRAGPKKRRREQKRKGNGSLNQPRCAVEPRFPCSPTRCVSFPRGPDLPRLASAISASSTGADSHQLRILRRDAGCCERHVLRIHSFTYVTIPSFLMETTGREAGKRARRLIIGRTSDACRRLRIARTDLAFIAAPASSAAPRRQRPG